MHFHQLNHKITICNNIFERLTAFLGVLINRKLFAPISHSISRFWAFTQNAAKKTTISCVIGRYWAFGAKREGKNSHFPSKRPKTPNNAQ
jgi:hypothetical protein